MKQDLLYDPSVFRVGCDYQIIFRTKTKGLGWVEIDGARYTDEECGLLKYGTVHKISVPGAAATSTEARVRFLRRRCAS